MINAFPKFIYLFSLFILIFTLITLKIAYNNDMYIDVYKQLDSVFGSFLFLDFLVSKIREVNSIDYELLQSLQYNKIYILTWVCFIGSNICFLRNEGFWSFVWIVFTMIGIIYLITCSFLLDKIISFYFSIKIKKIYYLTTNNSSDKELLKLKRSLESREDIFLIKINSFYSKQISKLIDRKRNKILSDGT